MAPLVLTAAQVAEALSTSVDTIDARLREGQFPRPRRWGGKRVWPKREIEEFAESLPFWDDAAQSEPEDPLLRELKQHG